jgi:hypothetical protein
LTATGSHVGKRLALRPGKGQVQATAILQSNLLVHLGTFNCGVHFRLQLILGHDHNMQRRVPGSSPFHQAAILLLPHLAGTSAGHSNFAELFGGATGYR